MRLMKTGPFSASDTLSRAWPLGTVNRNVFSFDLDSDNDRDRMFR